MRPSCFGIEKLEENKKYNIQAIIRKEITFHTKNCKMVKSLILEDAQKRKIELIAWDEQAKFIQQQNIKLDKMYCIRNLKAIYNIKYPKTNHIFKLQLDIPYSEFKIIDFRSELNA